MKTLNFIDSWHHNQYKGSPNMKTFIFRDEYDKEYIAQYARGLISFYDDIKGYMQIQYGFNNPLDNSVSLETVKEWLNNLGYEIIGYEKIKSDYGQW